MRYVKIEFPMGVLSAVTAEYALDRAGVKQCRRGTAVIALSDMHNTKVVANVTAENKGYEVEPTQGDIDFLNNKG